MARRPLVAGNWKMNGTLRELSELSALREAAEQGLREGHDLLICPPATILSASHGILGEFVAVGGQDCHSAESGAHTGDISAAMLRDIGARYVIVGHSERRADHNEDNTMVRGKALAALSAGLIPIVCIGETEADRDSGRTLDVLREQLDGSLPDGASEANTVIAYEPVWAIGTGRTPTLEDVAEVHGFIRYTISQRFGETVSEGIRILYGGSVKPANAADLLAVDGVDGALVGGASLKAADFVAICEASVSG